MDLALIETANSVMVQLKIDLHPLAQSVSLELKALKWSVEVLDTQLWSLLMVKYTVLVTTTTAKSGLEIHALIFSTSLTANSLNNTSRMLVSSVK